MTEKLNPTQSHCGELGGGLHSCQLGQHLQLQDEKNRAAIFAIPATQELPCPQCICGDLDPQVAVTGYMWHPLRTYPAPPL